MRPGMRLKTHWFRDATPRDPAQVANALAAIVWRSADVRLRNLRKGRFEIEAGPGYLQVLVELLVFLCVVADRIALRYQPAPWRETFTSALVRRVGGLLQDSFDDLLGPAPGGGYGKRFVDRFNLRVAEYGEFDYHPHGPEFALLRYFGELLTQAMPEAEDRRWSLDQAMTVEGPECVDVVEKSMRGLLGLEPRPQRVRGEAGE
ncbi:MAG: hypothetical protein KJ011_10705 [Burkholderiaceae bacterium]|nr:hypothetical protein [Burkholderiaceae bacterium]